MDIMPFRTFLQNFKEGVDNDKRFCFILGSGVLVESGVPSGKNLSKMWFEELQEIYREENLGFKRVRENLGLEDFDLNRAIEDITENDYFNLFDLRYYGNYKVGYDRLETYFEQASASLGYFLLAKIICHKKMKNNLVITTNFDSLIEETIFFLNRGRSPLILDSESILEFIDINIERPMVLKVNRGSLYNPMRRKEALADLIELWKEPLSEIFKKYTPVVTGYGENQLFILSLLESDEIIFEKGIYWCCRDVENICPEVKILLQKKNGNLVDIDGFDSMMFGLVDELGYMDIEADKLAIENKMKTLLHDYDEKHRKFKRNYERENNHGERFYRIGKERKKRAKELIAKNPDDIEGYQALGDAYRYLEEFDKGLSQYNIVLEKDPRNYNAILGRAYCYRRLEMSTESIKDYDRAIVMNPESKYPYNNRGIVYSQINKQDLAIENFDKAISIDPNFAYALNNRGVSKAKLGKYKEALDDYNLAIKINPDSSYTYNNRGVSLANLGKNKDAVIDYNRSLGINPKYVDAYNNRGKAYRSMGNYQLAIDDYTNAINLKPEYGEAYNNRGVAYYILGNYEDALKDFDRAMELDPKNSNIYYNRNLTYEKLEENGLADNGIRD